METLSSEYYVGSERSMIPNCLFRMGASATIVGTVSIPTQT